VEHLCLNGPKTDPAGKGGNRHDVTWVRLCWSERRVREQAVPVVLVVQAARAGAVRAGPW